jgi:hypothetical protein
MRFKQQTFDPSESNDVLMLRNFSLGINFGSFVMFIDWGQRPIGASRLKDNRQIKAIALPT